MSKDELAVWHEILEELKEIKLMIKDILDKGEKNV